MSTATRWKGISSDTTDVDDTPGVSVSQYNTRMQTEGELQRRYGFQNTTMAKRAGRILNIISAIPTHGSFIFTGGLNGAGTSVTVDGEDFIPFPPRPPKKPKPPPPQPPDVCEDWGPFNETGTLTDIKIFTLPRNSCAGTITMTGIEDVARRTSYGYSFEIAYEAIVVHNSACLLDDAEVFAIPAGTRSIVISITGGCFDAGGDVGEWQLSLEPL